jgi:CubicO group peptidase (beta-lactamase class C family)
MTVTSLGRRTAMRLIAGASVMPSCLASATTADVAELVDAGIRSGMLRDLHAIAVSSAGQTVLERYCVGNDQSWGRPLGVVTFGPETLHDLRSVTKSIVGLLYGIALDRGLVPPPDARVLAQFPDYADLADDPRRSRITSRDHTPILPTARSQWRVRRIVIASSSSARSSPHPVNAGSIRVARWR